MMAEPDYPQVQALAQSSNPDDWIGRLRDVETFTIQVIMLVHRAYAWDPLYRPRVDGDLTEVRRSLVCL